MIKYIYDLYPSIGISPTMITAIVYALIGTIVIFGAIMIHRVVIISREIKELPSNGLSEEQWNILVERVMMHHKIKHAAPLIISTYAGLLLVNYFLIIVR